MPPLTIAFPTSDSPGSLFNDATAHPHLYSTLFASSDTVSNNYSSTYPIAQRDPTQQAVNSPSWLGPGQWPTGPYFVAERPSQHNSPSLQQTPANLTPPPRGIPTQRNFVSAAPQSNLTQMSSHASANGLPFNGVLAQINDAPLQQSSQITHPPTQQPIQPNKPPVLSEDRFKSNFMQFTRSKGIRLTERDLTIDGRHINLWALHRAVFSRNGFESVRHITPQTAAPTNT